MTNKEKNAVSMWNKHIGQEKDLYAKRKAEVEEKYLRFNGSRSCCLTEFILQIARTEGVSDKMKRNDIEVILQYILAQGQQEALFKYLDTMQ